MVKASYWRWFTCWNRSCSISLPRSLKEYHRLAQYAFSRLLMTCTQYNFLHVFFNSHVYSKLQTQTMHNWKMKSIPTIQPAVVREINPEGLILKCMYNWQNRINICFLHSLLMKKRVSRFRISFPKAMQVTPAKSWWVTFKFKQHMCKNYFSQ